MSYPTLCPRGHSARRHALTGDCLRCSEEEDIAFNKSRQTPGVLYTGVFPTLRYPKTKAVAQSLGVSRFFTKKPCRHGHHTFRRTDNGLCQTCCTKSVLDFRPWLEDPKNQAYHDAGELEREARDREILDQHPAIASFL